MPVANYKISCSNLLFQYSQNCFQLESSWLKPVLKVHPEPDHTDKHPKPQIKNNGTESQRNRGLWRPLFLCVYITELIGGRFCTHGCLT